MKHTPTIGMEVHVELKTDSKMFCGCKNELGLDRIPNSNICAVCTGQPGSLPVANEKAIEFVVRAGLALDCEIAKISKFDRKNYFYPDLPKGYQISQYDQPLCAGGFLMVGTRKVGITRIHLEEDTGKLLHQKGTDYSLVDFNRAGVPLMELVTEPDIESAEEAKKFCEELQLILRYLGISDADMEKGQMRCEVNISLSNKSRIKSNDSRIVLPDESYRLMGLLFEIHNKLGPIYKEINYQDAIEEVLKRENLPYEREKEIKLKLDNLKLSNLFADFIIDDKVLIEVKAKKFITEEDVRQAARYIKSQNLPLAIIANFKRQKLESKRVTNPAFEKNSISFDKNSGKRLGTKVEIKNLNSFKAVERAIEFEIKRQSELLDEGNEVVQETRGWDESKMQTFSQREKESAHDYRYFPEPDLPPLEFDEGYAEKVRNDLPELPADKMKRFQEEYKLSEYDTEVLVREKDLADFFEQAVSEACTESKDKEKIAKLTANYILSELKKYLSEKVKVADLKVTPENFGELICLVKGGKLNSTAAKAVLEEMIRSGADPEHIIAEKGLGQIEDDAEIEKIFKKVLLNNSGAVEDYKSGKEPALQFLLGQIMREAKGRVNPETAMGLLKKELDK